MALSGKKEVTCGYRGHYHLFISVIVNRQDKAAGESNVTVDMYANSDDVNYKWAGNTNAKLSADGAQKVSQTIAVNFYNKQTVKLASWTGDVQHDSKGDKKLTVSGSFTATSDWLSGGNISYTIDLDNIPPATVPTLSVQSVELGQTLTIGIRPKAAGWRHRIYYRLGAGHWTTIYSGAAESYNWTVPKDIANLITDADSAALTIGLHTYSDSAMEMQVGGVQTADVKVMIPSDMVPVISSVSATDTVPEMAVYGAYVQGKSRPYIRVEAAGSYGSTIVSYKVTAEPEMLNKWTSTANTIKTGVVYGSGDRVYTVTVTDSRGRTGQKAMTINVLPYQVPEITQLTCRRCDQNGNIKNNGQYVKVMAAFSVSPLDNKNGNAYKIEYKPAGGTEYITLTYGNTYVYDREYITGGVFLPTNAYDIRLTVDDSFTSAVAYAKVNTANYLISCIAKRMAVAIGKAAELWGIFDVALPTLHRETVTFMDDVTFEGKIINPQKVLWSGIAWPNDTQTVMLSGKVSDQANGIVLVFSRYDTANSKPLDDNFVCYFVPKQMVLSKPGVGYAISMISGNFGGITLKYVYVHDDQVVGSSGNTASGTNNGITYNNKTFALRYVIGV